MAMNYRVGQRVKKVAHALSGAIVPLGAIGTINRSLDADDVKPGCYGVVFDEVKSDHASGGFSMYPFQLAPLTSPGENEWADSKLEALKRLVREPLPVHPSQLEEA